MLTLVPEIDDLLFVHYRGHLFFHYPERQTTQALRPIIFLPTSV